VVGMGEDEFKRLLLYNHVTFTFQKEVI